MSRPRRSPCAHTRLRLPLWINYGGRSKEHATTKLVMQRVVRVQKVHLVSGFGRDLREKRNMYLGVCTILSKNFFISLFLCLSCYVSFVVLFVVLFVVQNYEFLFVTKQLQLFTLTEIALRYVISFLAKLRTPVFLSDIIDFKI